jgi:IS5 family transposase
MATADAGFFSAANEARAEEMGCPAGGCSQPVHPERHAQAAPKKRWFRKAQRWRTGSEGRISVLKRRHGMNRSRYKGSAGNKRDGGGGGAALTSFSAAFLLSPLLTLLSLDHTRDRRDRLATFVICPAIPGSDS